MLKFGIKKNRSGQEAGGGSFMHKTWNLNYNPPTHPRSRWKFT